jgi:hypothetical protein
MKYTQCLLIKHIFNNGIFRTIAWIPSKYAKPYKILKLKDDNNKWQEGWEVVECYSEHDKKFVEYHERDFAKQRDASDI